MRAMMEEEDLKVLPTRWPAGGDRATPPLKRISVQAFAPLIGITIPSSTPALTREANDGSGALTGLRNPTAQRQALSLYEPAKYLPVETSIKPR